MKLPESERPDPATLERFLAVSPELRARFTVDFQNDCACKTELYDGGVDPVAYWNDGPVVREHMTRVALPIHEGVLTDTEIMTLFEAFTGGEHLSRLTGLIAVNLRGWGLMMGLLR